MKIRYFAWLRERVGRSEENVEPPSTVRDVEGLLHWLRGRGGGYGEAFADLSIVRVAVNQEYAERTNPVTPEDEIALFPPVTGG